MMENSAALILTDESRAVCLLLFCLLPFYFCLPRWVGSRAEALSVLVRVDEGFDHLGGDVVAVELVELREPELPAREV